MFNLRICILHMYILFHVSMLNKMSMYYKMFSKRKQQYRERNYLII